MKKYLLILSALSTIAMSYADVSTPCSAFGSAASSCGYCFRATNKPYTNDGITTSDRWTNTSTNQNQYLWVGAGQFSVGIQPLNSSTWNQSTSLSNMFEITQYTGTSGGAPYLLYLPGESATWIRSKSGQFFRFLTPGTATNQTTPLFRISYTLQVTPQSQSGVNGSPQTHTQCTFVYGRWCGDGVIDSDKGEQCDNGSSNGTGTCSSTCQNQVASCTNLSVSATSVTNGGNVTYTCTGNNVNSYSITLKRQNGTTLQTLTSASGTLTIPATPNETYTAACFVNGQTTTPAACQKTITNNTTSEPVCTNLSVSPTSVTNGGSVTYTCTGNNVTSYSIIAKNPDGTTLASSASPAGSITIPANTVGDYNISCFVNGQITTPASCQKTVTNTTQTTPVCNNLSVSTTSVTNGGNVTYTCSGTNASSYSIQLTNPNNDTIQTFTTATGSLTIPAAPTGTYTARCFINGQTSTPSACVKTISNTTVTENPVCNNLTVSRSGTNIDYTCSGSGPISSYTIQRNGNFVSNAQSGTINAGYGTHTIRCLVNTSITSTACEKTITIERDTPRPEIEVIKDDNDNRDDQQHINIGGVAQFSIRVRNIGTEAIDTVNLTDQLAPECSKSTFETNNIMGKNILYPGESFTYVCHRSNVDQYTFPNNENRICVNGRGVQSGIPVNDCDTTRVYFGETQNPACQNIQVSQNGNQVTAVCSPNGGYRLYVLQGNQVVNNFQNPNGQFSFNLNNGNYKIACLRDGERELQAACQRNISVGGTPTNNACIMRSSNRYGGAPLRTELTCESQNYSSCTMRINKDGMLWQTINDCSSPVVFDQRGNYEAICYLDAGENCSTTVQVDIMTVIPTGPFLPTIIILALGGAGYITYRRRRAA